LFCSFWLLYVYDSIRHPVRFSYDFFYDFRLNMLTDWNMKRLNFFIFYWYIKPRISTYHFESFSVAIMLRATTVTNVFPFIIANAIFFNPINTMYSTCGVRDIYSSRATGSNSWLLVWFVLLNLSLLSRVLSLCF
jgi:hypothetical protein